MIPEMEALNGAIRATNDLNRLLGKRRTEIQNNCEHNFPQRDNEKHPRCTKCGKVEPTTEWTLDL